MPSNPPPFIFPLKERRKKGQRNVLIRLPQQTLQAQQHAHDVQHGTPLLLEDVQADPARKIDVGMIDGRLEDDVRRRVGVRGREIEAQLEGQVGVGRVGGAGQRGRPGLQRGG